MDALLDDNFVASWTPDGQDGSLGGVYARHFTVPQADRVNDFFIDVLSNDTDADDGAQLTVVSAQVIQGPGSVQVMDNRVKFLAGSDFDTLAQGVTVEVVVEYTVADQHGAQSTSTVIVTVTGAG
jgi:hypothetical protein